MKNDQAISDVLAAKKKHTQPNDAEKIYRKIKKRQLSEALKQAKADALRKTALHVGCLVVQPCSRNASCRRT